MTCLMWFSDAACQGVIAACNRGGPMIAAPTLPAGATPGQRQSGRSSGVEHNLAKVGVEGSNPFARSRFHNKFSEIQLSSARSAGYENRSEEHTSELQSLMRISYAVFCLKKKKTTT